MSKIYENAIGITVRVNCGRDITSASTHTIQIKKPDGTTDEWEADVADTNYLEYTTVDGDLSPAGLFEGYANVTLGGIKSPGETFQFRIWSLYQ